MPNNLGINISPRQYALMGLNPQYGQMLMAQMEQARRREQIKRQFQDMQNLSQALQGYREGRQAPPGVGVPRGRTSLSHLMQTYQPETKTGLGMISGMWEKQMQPPKSYTLKPGEVRYQGRQPIARGMPEQQDRWSEPFKRGNDYVQRNLTSGKERRVHSVPETNVWSKPYKKDGQYMQRNKNTGEIKTLFAEDTGKQGLKTQRAIKKYQNAIKTTMSKYDINPNLMQFTTTDAQGNVSIDLQKFREFQENPYQVLKQKAKSGDPTARRDLKNVDQWMNKITDIAGGEPLPENPPDYKTNDPLGLFE